jgi:Ca2+-binding EF-hand superfamily protein
MTKLFQMIDKDNNGFISIKDLHLFTAKELPMDHCHAIIKECYLLL